MKKWMICLLCLCLLLSFFGCRPQSTNIPVRESTDATEPSQQTESIPQNSEITEPSELTTETTLPTTTDTPSGADTEAPLVAVSLDPILEEDLAEDGTSIFQFQSQKLTVYLSNSEAAQVIMDSMAASYADAAESAQEIRTWAQQDYENSESWTAPYSCQISYTPSRTDTAVISFSGKTWQVTGGMHPNYALISKNYDTDTGFELSLGDVLSHADMAQALYLKVMDGLSRFATSQEDVEIVYNDGYEQIVEEHFNLDNNLSDSWYFGSTGMTFYFSPYEIAPYAVGGIEIQIPYEELDGILSDRYLPEVYTNDETFAINAALKEQVKTGDFLNVLTATVDAEGEGIAVFSGGTIYNVQLSLGFWSDDANASSTFQTSQTLFSANRLTDQDLLLIHAFIPDAQPSLCLTMQTGEKDRTYYISQSGDDGSILLLENP